MNVLIAGSGKTLFFLCRAFTAKGHAVTLVNTNRDECEQLAHELPALVIHGDASEADVLKEAGAMRADVVLAITPKDQDNLVICQLAALQFGTPRTLALANDPDNAPIFEQLGVHAFSTTEIISSLIEQRASLEQVLTQLTIGQGRVNVTELLLDTGSPVDGKAMKDIPLPDQALVAVVLRSDKPIVPRGGTVLHAGDRVVLVTLPENHGPVIKVFTGEA